MIEPTRTASFTTLQTSDGKVTGIRIIADGDCGGGFSVGDLLQAVGKPISGCIGFEIPKKATPESITVTISSTTEQGLGVRDLEAAQGAVGARLPAPGGAPGASAPRDGSVATWPSSMSAEKRLTSRASPGTAPGSTGSASGAPTSVQGVRSGSPAPVIAGCRRAAPQVSADVVPWGWPARVGGDLAERIAPSARSPGRSGRPVPADADRRVPRIGGGGRYRDVVVGATDPGVAHVAEDPSTLDLTLNVRSRYPSDAPVKGFRSTHVGVAALATIGAPPVVPVAASTNGGGVPAQPARSAITSGPAAVMLPPGTLRAWMLPGPP